MGSSWWRRRLVLLILCVLQPMLPVSHGCFPEERAALMEIRASLVRGNSTAPLPPWGKRLSGHDDCCSWKRVRCSNATRRISHLDLSFVYINLGLGNSSDPSWSLDTTIFVAFPELQFLDLSFNEPMAPLSFDGFKNLSNLRELDLSYDHIRGNLPSFLFSLPHIELLNLSGNLFEGPIPISSSSNLSLSLRSLRLSDNNLSGRLSFFWLKNLNNLVEIDLSGNANLVVNVNSPGWVPRFQLKRLLLNGCDLDKDIIAKPKFLSTQHHLEDLDLSNNNLSGDMPNWLFTKGSNLSYLDLGNNSLTGSLDPIRYPQTSLQHIDISMNNIVGQLQANISSVFPSLISIDVSNNNFSGEIPTSLCHNDIQYLHLYNNKFSGEMPACLFTDLPNLLFLRVSNNHLGGQILGGRNNLSIGAAMHLDGNKFEGALPRNLSGELWLMDLHDNKLTGELDASSWNLSRLLLLDVAGNHMTGEIQQQICALPSIFLDLSSNHFTGPIRSCNNTSLRSLNVSMNSLSGDVLWENLNTSNLAILDARHNMLTGNLSWLHHFDKMSLLSIGHNKFHGQIPLSLCEMKYPRIIDLSHNKLSGPVPSCIGAMSFQDDALFGFEAFSSIKIYQYMVNVEAEGSFTFGTKGMQLTYGPTIYQMSGIDLSGNLLSGEIPRELGELRQVKSLNLSRNALAGPIPTSLANMSELESLDLSHNKLTGVIPPELTRLWSLEVFSVAYNHLSGCVPSSGQFGSFGADSYEGNNQLKMECSSSPHGLEPSPVPPRDQMVVDAGPYAIGAASFVLAFWATVAYSLCRSVGRPMILKL